MNWRKILKYTLVVIALIVVIGFVYVQLMLGSIFGGRTEVVESSIFIPDDFPVLIENISILSEDGQAFLPNQSVLIQNGIITAIDSTINQSASYQVMDGAGKFLIPGLIDSHVHLYQSPNDLLLYVANGVTEIREMDGREAHLEWRRQINQGERIGPDMYITSPRIQSLGLVEGWFTSWTQGINVVNNEKQAKKYVQKVAAKGYDGIKIYSQLNKEAYQALNMLAPTKKLDVLGHIPFKIDLEDLFASNQKEVAHLEELNKPALFKFGRIRNRVSADSFLMIVDQESRKFGPRLAENNIGVTTTLWLMESFVKQKFALDQTLSEVDLVYVNPGISEWREGIPGLGWLPKVNRYRIKEADALAPAELDGVKIFWETYAEACRITLRNLVESGVVIMAGTDANVPVAVPGFSLHDELYSMQESGMSAIEILRAATSAPANWMNRRTGVIKEGYNANLVLLDKNPLHDIRNTQSIHAVMKNGQVYPRSVLDDLLSAVEEANNKSRKIEITKYIND